MSDDTDGFSLGGLITGMFVVGGIMKILDYVDSANEKTKAETKAIQQRTQQQQEIDELKREVKRLKGSN